MASDMSEADALRGLIENMRQASAYVTMLAHLQQNPMFLALRDSFTALQETAVKMAISKPVARSEVVAMLDARQKIIRTDG